MALAVGAALAAPGLALAQATNVQVYGLFDLRVDQMKISANTAATRAELKKYHVASSTVPNRIGFRGTESLGGGMSAFFQIETQVFSDSKQDIGGSAGLPNALVGGRPTFAGLRGNWGEVSLGLQDSPFGNVWKQTWQVGPTQGHNGIIMNNGNSSGAMPSPNCSNLANPATGVPNVTNLCQENKSSATQFDRRISDSILYQSPVIRGFRFATMMIASEFKEPSSSTPAGTAQHNASFSSFSLNWSGGPFAVAGAFERHVGFQATNTAGTDRMAKDSGLALGARYNYGKGLIGAGWEKLKYGNPSTAAVDTSFELTNYTLQGTFNVTPSDILAVGYSKTPGRKACGSGLTTAANTCGDPTGAKMWTMSYDHRFSKRTGVYALYSKIDNNAGATYYYIAGPTTNNAGGTQGGLAAGADVTMLALGIKHSF